MGVGVGCRLENSRESLGINGNLEKNESNGNNDGYS